jgi:hypothetical protein
MKKKEKKIVKWKKTEKKKKIKTSSNKSIFEKIMEIYNTLKEENNNLVVQLNGLDFLFQPNVNKEKQEALSKRLLSIMKHFSDSEESSSNECYYEIKFGLLRFHNKNKFIKSHLIELIQE